jgi:hypothetical protein
MAMGFSKSLYLDSVARLPPFFFLSEDKNVRNVIRDAGVRLIFA